MALGSMRKNRKPFTPPRLMITSLMDMFTIILIFLLFSFSDNPEKIMLDPNLDLPKSAAKLDHEDCIRLVFTRDSLKLQDEVIATVHDEQIIGLDPDNLKASELYKKLRKIYEDPASNRSSPLSPTPLNAPVDGPSIASPGGETSPGGEASALNAEAGAGEINIDAKKKPLLFLCDKQHTFKSINQVIKTAGMAGFPNFQFAVLKK
jgi:biopolymer transport protein ExbD